MKKILFGTSALIATAFTSVGGASAAGLELNFSGSYVFGGGFIYSKLYDHDRDIESWTLADGEIVATAKGTLDNGLTFGAKIEFDIEGNAYDESVGWVEGSFGRLEVGHEDGAHDRLTPGVKGTWFNAADGGGFLFDYFASDVGADFGFDGDETSDSLKVTYFTPSFSGFRASVSYIPNTRGGRGGEWETTTVNEAWELGARYTGNFNDFSVDVGGGYTIDPHGTRTRDDSWAVSGNVGFQQFTLGAAYEDRGARRENVGTTAAYTQDRGTGFAVGGSYNTGPWTFGAAYVNGKSITAGESKAQGASLGVDYELGQGVTVSAGLEWVDVKDLNDDIFGGGLVTQLAF